MKVLHAVIVITATLIFSGTRTFADWSTPVPLGEVNTQYAEAWPTISSDGKTLYFVRGNNPNNVWNQMYQASRASTSAPFSNVTSISSLSYNGHVNNAWVSSNGQHMYYTRSGIIAKSIRSTAASSWETTSNLNEFNFLGPVSDPKLASDELSIVFTSISSSNGAMYTASRSSTSAAFSNIRVLSELNNAVTPRVACLSGDGLMLYYDRVDDGIWHTYSTVRSSVDSTFGTPQQVGFADNFRLGSFSADGQTAYLYRYDNGNWNIYTSTIPEPCTMVLLGLGGLVLRRRK